jgi:hypothetical protein
MTSKAQERLGVKVAVAGLGIMIVSTIAAGAVGYGKLQQSVSSVEDTMNIVDARSIDNGKVISGIEGKLDLIIKHVVHD